MTLRLLVSIGVPIAAALLGDASTPVVAQGPRAAEMELAVSDGWSIERHRALARIIQGHLGVKSGWRAPRTAWGHPDLTGAWTSDGVHGVPRERPVAQGARMFLTEDEYRNARRVKSRPARPRSRHLVQTPAGAIAHGADR